MAEVFGQVSMSVKDEIGTLATVLLPTMLDTTKTLAELEAGALAIASDVEAVTSGQIMDVKLMVFCDISGGGFRTAPLAGSRVEQTGLVNFGNDTTRYRFGIDFPALLDSLIVGGKIVLDSGALHTLALALITGDPGNGLLFVNSAQQAITSIVDGLVTFRKHRAAVERRTKVVG